MGSTNQDTSMLSRWLPVLVWAGMIFALSSVPGLRASTNTTLDLILRKAAHAFEFAVLGFLTYRALVLPVPRQTRRTFLLTLGIGTIYALSDEWHQGFVATRVSALRDVLIDSIGVLIGTSMAVNYFQRLHTKTPASSRSEDGPEKKQV